MKKHDRRLFLKSSATMVALGFASLSVPKAAHALASSATRSSLFVGKIWRNWSGSVVWRAKEIFSPSTLGQFSDLIKKSAQMRFAGKGCSFSALVPSPLIAQIHNYRDIQIDAKRMRVKVLSGTRLSELNETLQSNGFALQVLGNVDVQTVGGLVSTATRGAGIGVGSFSDAEILLAITMIDAEGRLKRYDLEADPYNEIHQALRLGLGCLGFIESVELRICPSYNLREEVRRVAEVDALNPSNYLDNLKCSMTYYPFAEAFFVITQNYTKEQPNLSQRKKRKLKDKYLENTVADALIKVAAKFPRSIPRLMKMFVKNLSDEVYVDHWHQVIVNERTMRYNEIQYTFDVDKLGEVLEVIKQKVQEFSHSKVYYADLPFLFRFGRKDRAVLLSPTEASANDLCFQVDVNAHVAQKNYDLFFRSLEKEFVRLGGLPHWGKLFYIRPQHPNLARFEAVRKQLDPSGKFVNSFVKRFISLS